VIGDLGLAKSIESTEAFAGTRSYMAPEFFLGKKSGCFSDIW